MPGSLLTVELRAIVKSVDIVNLRFKHSISIHSALWSNEKECLVSIISLWLLICAPICGLSQLKPHSQWIHFIRFPGYAGRLSTCNIWQILALECKGRFVWNISFIFFSSSDIQHLNKLCFNLTFKLKIPSKIHLAKADEHNAMYMRTQYNVNSDTM